MNTVFPLALMRKACELSAKGYAGYGYKHRTPMLINAPAPDFLRCGRLHLVRVVNVSATNVFNTGLTCYINNAGEFVFPA
jgi:hypothetical protein